MKEIELLINSKLFSANHIKEEKIKNMDYKKGQFISDFFDEEYYVGAVKKGEVSVYCISSDGSEINMSILKEGDVFGISNIFEEEALETILKCKNNVSVVFYPKKDFIEMLNSDVKVALEYSKHCNRKIQFLLRKIAFLNIQSIKTKIIEYLLEKSDEDDMVFLEYSKEELSKRLGVSRASLYRELHSLQNENYIEINKRSIKIIDREKIMQLLYQL